MTNTHLHDLYTNNHRLKQDFHTNWTETTKMDWKIDFPEIPVGLTVPVIASNDGTPGKVKIGDLVTVTPGTYSGKPAPVVTHQWRNDSGIIAGQTGLTYTASAGDVGHMLAVDETATNAEGALVVRSAPIGAVVAS